MSQTKDGGYMDWLKSGVLMVLVFALPLVTWSEVRPPIQVATNVPPTQEVTPKQLQSTLEQQLREQFPMNNVDFSVDILFPKQPILVPKGRVGIEIPPDTMNGRTGRRSIRGAIHVDSQYEQMVNLVADISAHTKVVVPVRFIKAHEVVKPEDINMMDVALPALQHEYLDDVDMAIGKKTMRLLSPNLPIQKPYLTSPPVIHKGDRVVLEVRQGALLVQAVGIAKDSGEPGKTIAVENQQSGREVLGKVVNSGLVEVLF
ncbi:flagellar basal body P-ring formation chaperone FlgA [Candidatus Nitronereus thalassa]|uniref:Flagellar basal body P-ring formation chaperone FlgA n=1 Tax=Candidatus Nitronereus thalassa TaxID=3020898 RepID=A0ABU3K651_9BACT|nr:flagellar basal body P-ring formation chaperone FlgA [Candidatus Nitronereus thalassa]MDT7041868.1 flagellar basal body P-ring formation chaperone FlgA [Candidatus Nitronereus thalassa]